MAYTPPVWDAKAKYRKQESCTCGCSDPKECSCGHKEHIESCECEDKDANGGCGCPPPGLVAVKNGDGNFSGFLTPGDAQNFMAVVYACPPGYIKDIDDNGNFRSCVTIDDYKTLHP